jgi:hypothetical protein
VSDGQAEIAKWDVSVDKGGPGIEEKPTGGVVNRANLEIVTEKQFGSIHMTYSNKPFQSLFIHNSRD